MMKFLTIVLDCYAYFYQYRINKLNKQLVISNRHLKMIKNLLNVD